MRSSLANFNRNALISTVVCVALAIVGIVLLIVGFELYNIDTKPWYITICLGAILLLGSVLTIIILAIIAKKLES